MTFEYRILEARQPDFGYPDRYGDHDSRIKKPMDLVFSGNERYQTFKSREEAIAHMDNNADYSYGEFTILEVISQDISYE